MATTELIESFTRYAKEKVDREGNDLSIDDLFDEWRTQYPLADDLLAIKASLRVMENGETGRPFDEFSAEFRLRNNIQQAK
jgi:hypothetical protein